MKQVTMESVKQRIADLESAGKVVGGLSLSSEFELSCLRELVAVTEQRDALVVEAIPEGYVLVPQEMHLPAESMEGICVHCGDGGHQFGEFTDGTLFVGEVDYGDGKKVYGLHIATAEYPEEGCSTICEFARQLRESKGASHGD